MHLNLVKLLMEFSPGGFQNKVNILSQCSKIPKTKYT